MKIKTTFIKYDTDGDEEIAKALPQKLIFDFEDLDDAESNLPDKISDITGWCVFSCDYKVISE